jgi:hypothetical protein
MTKYSVHLLIPIDIEVEAKNEQQAKKKAWELLRAEAREDVWLVPKLYEGKSMHELELEKHRS